MTAFHKGQLFPVQQMLIGLFFCPFFMLILTDLAFAQVQINANDRGWYNSGGSHNPGNNNTYTGFYISDTYRSYYRFTIPSGVTCISSATLELEVEAYYGDGSPHTVDLFDVLPVHVPDLDIVNGNGNGVAIHTDLGSGSAYGTRAGLTSASIGSVLSFTLPAAAITQIVNASGGDFAVGAMSTSSSGGTFWGLRFSGGNETRIHRLTYTECPPLPDLKAKKNVEIYDPNALNLYALPGNDVVYTITVTNEGLGPVDTDTMELIDYLPPDMIFYNDDIDDGGPESEPVAWSENGSGLSFNYATDVAFSNSTTIPQNFSACSYSPSVGYDPNITYICFNPKGQMATGNPNPTFSLKFRSQIK